MKIRGRKINLIIVALILSQGVIAQIPTSLGFTLSDKFSESIAVVKGQAFLLKEVLNTTEDVVQFELEGIASSFSGDLTTLFYKCEKKNAEGLILAFYGDYWNEAGDIYKGFVFKNLPKNEALEFLSKITTTMEEQRDFLSKDNDNNAYFQYGDLSVVISGNIESKIRLFWNGFDAEWDHWAFARTKRTLETGIN